MTAPSFMPVLSRGAHPSPTVGSCVMEYVSILAGEPFSDHPMTVHPLLGTVARFVNDHLDECDVPKLGRLAVRFIGTADAADALRAVNDPQYGLEARLAVYLATTLLDDIPEDRRPLFRSVLRACDAVLGGVIPRWRLLNAVSMLTVNLGQYAHQDRAERCAVAVITAAESVSAMHIDERSANAVGEFVMGVIAQFHKPADMIGALEALLDEFDRLTGHTLAEPVGRWEDVRAWSRPVITGVAHSFTCPVELSAW